MLVQEILIPHTRALAVNPLVVRPVGRSEEGGEEAHGDQVDRAICVHGRAADSTCEVWGMVVGSSVNVNVCVIRVPVCARVSRVYPNSPNVFLPDPVLYLRAARHAEECRHRCRQTRALAAPAPSSGRRRHVRHHHLA